ncbi:MAG: hypothetical protein IJU91_00360 [Selenomonadaceae bacterium]|nr:hypothetical protein [Selenomonadaceae bacterium]
MKISPPNDEEQISIESAESSQDSLSGATNNDSGIDLGEFVADTIELVSSILSD